jgi:hypothetical protein
VSGRPTICTLLVTLIFRHPTPPKKRLTCVIKTNRPTTNHPAAIAALWVVVPNRYDMTTVLPTVSGFLDAQKVGVGEKQHADYGAPNQNPAVSQNQTQAS